MNRAILRYHVLQWMSRLLKWTTVDSSSAGGFIKTTQPPCEPTLGEEYTVQTVRFLQSFGLRSRPTKGTEVLIGAPRGGTTQPVSLASDNLGCGPSDLEEGATALYSSADRQNNGAQELCRVRLGADGKIAVDSKTGQDVVVNQGTKKVARESDTVDVGTIVVTSVANGVFTGTYTPPGGAAVPFQMPNATIHLQGKITSGADRFKA